MIVTLSLTSSTASELEAEVICQRPCTKGSMRPAPFPGDGVLAAFVKRNALSVAECSAPGTFPSKGPQRRIDYVLVSAGLEFGQQRVLDVKVSDHLPVLAEVRGRTF